MLPFRVLQMVLFTAVVAWCGCDSKRASSPPAEKLTATWSVAVAYAAPSDGPASSGSLLVESSRGATVEASFALSLDDGVTFQPLALDSVDAAGAHLDDATVSDFPADVLVDVTWNTGGLAMAAAITHARLRVVLDDGTETATIDSEPFVIDNTAASNTAPVIELLDSTGESLDLSRWHELTQGTWTIRATDAEPFDELALTVTLKESVTWFGTAGSDLSGFFDVTVPAFSGMPLSATATGNASGVEVELTRSLLGPSVADFWLAFEVSVDDGTDTVVETIHFGTRPSIGSGSHIVFVLNASSSMAFGTVHGGPVYDSAGTPIADPTPLEAAQSDLAAVIDNLDAGQRFDVFVITGSGFAMFDGSPVEATHANKVAAIAFVHSFSAMGGQQWHGPLEHAFVQPAYADLMELVVYSNGFVVDSGDIMDDLPGWVAAESSGFAFHAVQVAGSALVTFLGWIDAQDKCFASLRD